MKKIHTNKAPKAIGPYSQAINVGNLLFISGQLPINPETNLLETNIVDQTKRSLSNLKAIVEEAGFTVNNIVKTTVFLKDMNDFQEMNKVYEAFFKDHKPARSAIEVARLPKDAIVEIQAIASK